MKREKNCFIEEKCNIENVYSMIKHSDLNLLHFYILPQSPTTSTAPSTLALARERSSM